MKLKVRFFSQPLFSKTFIYWIFTQNYQSDFQFSLFNNIKAIQLQILNNMSMRKTKHIDDLRQRHNLSSILPTIVKTSQQKQKIDEKLEQNSEKRLNFNLKCFVPTNRLAQKHKSNQSMTNQQKIKAARNFLIDLRKSKDIKHYMYAQKVNKKQKRYKTIEDQDSPSVLTRKIQVRNKFMDNLKNQNQCIQDVNMDIKGTSPSNQTNNNTINQANFQVSYETSLKNQDEDLLVERVKKWIDRRSIQLLRNGKTQNRITNRLKSNQDQKLIKQSSKIREIKILQTNNVLRCYSQQKQIEDPEKKQQGKNIQMMRQNVKNQAQQKDEEAQKIRNSYSFTYNLVKSKELKYKKKIQLKLKINETDEIDNNYIKSIKSGQANLNKQLNKSIHCQKNGRKLHKFRDQTLSYMINKYGMKHSRRNKKVEGNSVTQWDYQQCTDYDDNY